MALLSFCQGHITNFSLFWTEATVLPFYFVFIL